MSDPACNTFRDYLFDHPCSFVKEKGELFSPHFCHVSPRHNIFPMLHTNVINIPHAVAYPHSYPQRDHAKLWLLCTKRRFWRANCLLLLPLLNMSPIIIHPFAIRGTRKRRRSYYEEESDWSSLPPPACLLLSSELL